MTNDYQEIKVCAKCDCLQNSSFCDCYCHDELVAASPEQLMAAAERLQGTALSPEEKYAVWRRIVPKCKKHNLTAVVKVDTQEELDELYKIQKELGPCRAIITGKVTEMYQTKEQ